MPPLLDSALDHASRLTLLLIGLLLVVAGLLQADAQGVALVALGICAVALAAVLPRLERVRFFGPYGFDARMRVVAAPREDRCGGFLAPDAKVAPAPAGQPSTRTEVAPVRRPELGQR